jgi:hypothetical protein
VKDRLTVLVSGMVAGDPRQGGAAWAVLQWVLGLRRLGHRVVLVEPVDPAKLAGSTLATSAQGRYFDLVRRAFALEAALVVKGSTESVGCSYADAVAAARSADLLINAAGMLTDPELFGPPGRRVYLDLDPAFTQLWHHAQGIDMRLAGHDVYVTVGLRIGLPDCSIPTCGVAWRPTLPIVSLPDWEVAGALTYDAFTTIGSWRGYGSIHHGGVHYGQRAHSMRALATLPALVDERFLMAIAVHPEEVSDLDLLRRHDWELLDPATVAGTPEDYRAFVRGSKAEFGVAKSGYVRSRCGWFSDRSACYLASGRPVVAQETGFGGALPVGVGLLSYGTVDEAADAVRTIAGDYSRHAAAARAIAEEHVAAERVLPALLGDVLS